jgi:hypothetical protein
VTLPAGFDAAAIRVTGNVVGQPPFTGSLTHRGWRVRETRLPQARRAATTCASLPRRRWNCERTQILHRHRPRHHPLRALLRRYRSLRRRAGQPAGAADPATDRPRFGRVTRPAALVHLPAARQRTRRGDLSLPWTAEQDYAVGEMARSRGAATPIRLVSSAKSWLCHAGVDRRAAILPNDAPPEVARLSPLEASLRYLAHCAPPGTRRNRGALRRAGDRRHHPRLLRSRPPAS